MTIIVIHKDSIFKRPPVISSVLTLSDLGHSVHLITEGSNDYWSSEFQKRDITLHVIPRKTPNIPFFGRLIEYRNFKKECLKIANEYKDAVLWVEGGQTIFCLGDKIKPHQYILQIQELHNHNRFHFKAIGKLVNQAKIVFMPEYNRTILYQCWFKMNKRPVVLPNKPYFVPTEDELDELSKKYSDKLKVFKEKKVILYQGLMKAERDLTPFCKAANELGEEYALVLLGNAIGGVDHYKKICPNLVHIDFIPAPDYLVFTSMAYIGVVTYDCKDLNTAYCAPNKIYEYSAFMKPMLANDVPGLHIVKEYQAGIIVNENDTTSICNAIKQITDNYEHYCAGTKNLYLSADNKNTIEKAMLTVL